MNALTPYLVYIKLGIVALVVFMVYSFGVSHERTKRDLQDARIAAETQRLISEAQKENERLKDTLKEQYDENTKKLAILANSKPSRVRLPTCSPTSGETGASGNQATTPNGLLSGQVEAVLDSDRQRTWEIVNDAEQVINSCRMAVDYLKR